MQNNPRSIIETILVLLLLLSLMLALYDVVKVFFGVLTFALIFSVSFSDIFERLVRLIGNRRKLAAVIYSILLVAIVALPVLVIVGAVRAHIRGAIDWIGRIRASGLPPLPDWIGRLPIVGGDIQVFWQQLQDSPRDTITHHEEQVRMLLRHALTSGVGMISTILQVVVGIVISAFFLVSRDKILQPIKATVAHLLGRRDGLTLLAATTQAIKGVSIGMMGTAFVAAILAWIGLAIAGISFSLILAGLVFFLVLIQVGPLVVWVPVVVWSAMQENTATTVFLIIYGVGLLAVDGFLKPVLIARSGGKLPFLVMFLGVIGGLAAWGFTGMFKGAIIMAVFYTLFTSWLQKKRMSTS